MYIWQLSTFWLFFVVVSISVRLGTAFVTSNLQTKSGKVAFTFSHLVSSRLSESFNETSKDCAATIFVTAHDDVLSSKSMIASFSRLEPTTISQVDVSLNSALHEVLMWRRLYQ